MSDIMSSRPTSELNAAEKLFRLFHWLASGLAGASFALVVATFFAPLRNSPQPGWTEAVLVVTVTLTTLVAQTRRLPAQNALLAAIVIGLIGGVVQIVGAVTAIPFGPFKYTEFAGPRLFGVLAWPMPLLWIVVILNSRGVARLILRPWRKLRSYGFWLIGMTAALTALFDVALEPFASAVKHYWLWDPTRLPVTWGGAPVTSFLGWLLTALLILAFATPAMIDKRQQRATNRPPDYHPLGVWLLALVLFAVGAATEPIWLATAVCAGLGIVVGVFAIRGARW